MTQLLQEKNGKITELNSEEIFENGDNNIVIRMVDKANKIRFIYECFVVKKSYFV